MVRRGNGPLRELKAAQEKGFRSQGFRKLIRRESLETGGRCDAAHVDRNGRSTATANRGLL